MKLAGWHAILATRPATPNQVGAIIGEWRRLGLGHPDDRAERLQLTARLLGLPEVGSTTDLVMGDAGRLIGMLRGCGDRASLGALLDSPGAAVPPRLSPLAACLPLIAEGWRSMKQLRDPAAVASDHEHGGSGAGM